MKEGPLVMMTEYESKAGEKVAQLEREIERLRAEVERLRKALDTIAQVTIDPVAARRAREALQ